MWRVKVLKNHLILLLKRPGHQVTTKKVEKKVIRKEAVLFNKIAQILEEKIRAQLTN